MWCKGRSYLLIKSVCFLVLLAGCSSPTPAPPGLIADPELLIGNWEPLSDNSDAMFLQINSDGTCRQSYLLDGLSNIPEVECTFNLEGTDLSITAIKLNGVPECPSPTGVYEVQWVADNQIKLKVINDTCRPRVRSTSGLYQR